MLSQLPHLTVDEAIRCYCQSWNVVFEKKFKKKNGSLRATSMEEAVKDISKSKAEGSTNERTMYIRPATELSKT